MISTVTQYSHILTAHVALCTLAKLNSCDGMQVSVKGRRSAALSNTHNVLHSLPHTQVQHVKTGCCTAALWSRRYLTPLAAEVFAYHEPSTC